MCKLFFIGDLNEGTRSLMRAKKLEKLVKTVVKVSNTKVPYIAGIDKPSLIYRIFHKLGMPLDTENLNSKVVKLVGRNVFDIIWVEKSIMIKPSTLRSIRLNNPLAKIISVSEDDMFARHNRSVYYDKSLPVYDIVFTTKVYNLIELKTLGAQSTELFLDSFDEDLHRPLSKYSDIKIKNYKYDVCFVGTFERERAETMIWLGSKGVKVTIFGNGWSGLKDKHTNLIIKDRPVYGEEYVEVINNSKINLGFLRKINRDEVTSRTMEITACESFLIAERTSRHNELFTEGKEAEFFSTNKELYKKIQNYLIDDNLISEISKRGRRRCLQSGYDMTNQLSLILSKTMNS